MTTLALTQVTTAQPVAPPIVGARKRQAIVLFQWLLAIYTAIVLTKFHELVPVLNRLQPAKLCGVLLLVLAFAVMQGRAIMRVLRSPPAVCALLIAVFAILSTPGSVWPGNSVMFLATILWKTLLLFVISATAWCNRPTLRLSLRVLVIAQAAVAAAMVSGAAQAVMGRAYVGTAFDPNESAMQLLVVIPFALYVASRRGVWRLIGLGSMLLLVAGVVRTGSRGGFVGLAALAIWMILHVRPRRRRAMVALGVAAASVVVIVTASPATRERITSIFHPTEDYNYSYREGRMQVWRRGIGYMMQRPVFGVGVQGFPVADGVLSGKKNEGYGIKYSAAHNMFVQIGAELGVLGLLVFMRMLWASAAGARRILVFARRLREPDESHLAEAALGAFVAWLVGGFFLSVAYAPITFFVIAVCIAVRWGSPLPALARAPQAVAET